MSWFPALVLLAGSMMLHGCGHSPSMPATDTNTVGGVFTDATGMQQHGSPAELAYTGYGSYLYPQGDHYRGQFDNGLPHGHGVIEYQSGVRYSGLWSEGKRHGHGMLLAIDEIYVGEFKADRRAGSGRFYTWDSSFRGSWMDDLPHGFGSFIYANNNMYTGLWRHGVKSGRGLYFQQAEGRVLSGSWHEDKLDGYGETTNVQGGWYQGEWGSGLRDGYGYSLDPDGTSFEGTWQQGYREGFGIEMKIDGSRYEGEWHKGKRSGNGKAHSSNGEWHEGEWLSGLPFGSGTRGLADGTRISGKWQGDFLAEGRVELASGAVYTGPVMAAETDRASHRKGRLRPELITWLEQRGTGVGDSHAMNFLSKALLWGWQSSPPGYVRSEAQEWLRRAVAAGIPDARYRMAVQRLQAGTPLSQTEQRQWTGFLQMAAEKGYPEAGAMLGQLYADDDLHGARTYLRMAALSGSLEARGQLAWILATSEDADLRNGLWALSLARPLAYFKFSATHADILAAAYAEQNDFVSAQAAQRHAIRLLSNNNNSVIHKEYLQAMQERLQSYAHNHPWRGPRINNSRQENALHE